MGKFSSRNHQHEEQVAQILRKIPYLRIVKGHKVSGQQLLRRLVTAYYTAATKTHWAVLPGRLKFLQKRH